MAKRAVKEPKKKIVKEVEEPVFETVPEEKVQEIPGGKNDRDKCLDAAFQLIAGKLGTGEVWVEKVTAMGLDPQKVLEARMDILKGRI